MKYILGLLLILSFWQLRLNAQSNPTFTVFADSKAQASNITGTPVISFSATDKTTALLKQKNASAKLYIKLDLGDDYVMQTAAWDFKAQLTVNYQIGSGTPVSKVLEITDAHPEYLAVENVLPILNPLTGTNALDVNVISALTITDNSNIALTSGTLLSEYLNHNIRLSVWLEREYNVDVRLQSTGLMPPSPVVQPVTITNRLVTFNWLPVTVNAYPNYELQILKLYNTDDALQNNLNQITAVVDWSRALKVETQNHHNSVQLTMAEGTGYYIWRVRPIGNYYDGGIANSENYGEWSYSYPPSTVASLNKNTLTSSAASLPYAFYFTDPDEDLNWIYNRVFTEGDINDKANPTGLKSSEGISYADALLNAKQNQKYNSSENTTIVSQTINDYSGRPALSTIPVPVTGNLTGYKLGFVKNSAGNLYTAEMFDKDTNESDPDQVQDAATDPYGYYSSHAVGTFNKNVPDAEGYPFKRTKFKTDGTNRVTEESGIGKTHSLGLQTSNRGRTTRVMFENPSDDELIMLFGDEAPLAESVIKTVTVDPNNVTSISYTSKEGKTIATALVSETSDNLLPLQRAATSYTVKNSIDQNTVIDGNVIGSKRLSVATNSTVIKLSYTPGSLGGGSGCSGGDCNLNLRFYLVDLKQNVTYVSDANAAVAGNQPFPITTATFTPGWTLVSATGTITPSSGNEITLNEGEYIFIKEISSGNNARYADSVIDHQNDQYKLILDAIVAKMQQVTSANNYTVFTSWYNDLQIKIAAYTSGSPSVNTSDLIMQLEIPTADAPPGYIFPMTFTLTPLAQSTTDPASSDLEISTGCCGSMKVPIPKPDVCVLCDGNSDIPTALSIATMTAANVAALASYTAAPTTYTLITPYGMTDFITAGLTATTVAVADQLSAVQSLVELEIIRPLKDKMTEENMQLTDLWKIAPGYTFESLNFMLSNMLISRYFTGKSVEVSGHFYELTTDASGNYVLGGKVEDISSLPQNYDCKKIDNSWTNALMLLNSFEVDGGSNIVQGFNDQDGNNSAQDNVDDDSNWEGMSNFQKKYLKRKLSKELEDFSNSDDGKVPEARVEAITSLVSNFMNGAGYQFAAVIDGKRLPGYITTATSNTLIPADFSASAFTFTQTEALSTFTTVTVGTATASTISNVPVLFTLTGSTTVSLTVNTCSNTTVNELYYPYILKPEWIFKYYVYNVFNEADFIDDADALIPNQVLSDINRCYNRATDYVSYDTDIPLCKETCEATYLNVTTPVSFQNTHMYWSADERVNFYKEIMGSAKCYVNKGVDAVPPLDPKMPACPRKSVLVNSALSSINDYSVRCVDMGGAIKSALTDELSSSCYTLVNCKSGTGAGQVTNKEIDLMVKTILDKLYLQIQTIKDKITAIDTTSADNSCNPTATVTSAYGAGSTQLPYGVVTGCQDVILTSVNTLTVIPNTSIAITLFADCDKKILDMIGNGTFLPYIAPYGTCPNKPAKPAYYTDTKTQCGDSDYEEKTYSTFDFKTYSKTYSVPATSGH